MTWVAFNIKGKQKPVPSTLRDHPFNLKGGGGYGVFRSQNIFPVRSAGRIFFCNIIFFYTKTHF